MTTAFHPDQMRPRDAHDAATALATSWAGFESRLESGDLSLFAPVPSLTTEDDRRSLLSLQAAARADGPYAYLEIGSHRGGSLQPYLLDDRCVAVHSIEHRQHAAGRGSGDTSSIYAGISTATMLEGLAAAHGRAIDKISCFDRATRPVAAGDLLPRPRLCFIDGHHTDAAATADFTLSAEAIGGVGIIAFHDANLTYLAIDRILVDLAARGVPHVACLLPSTIVAIAFGGVALIEHPAVQRQVMGNYRGYLYSLGCNDHYRRFAHKPAFQWIRWVLARTRRRA